jgi:hypothetical protein
VAGNTVVISINRATISPGKYIGARATLSHFPVAQPLGVGFLLLVRRCCEALLVIPIFIFHGQGSSTAGQSSPTRPSSPVGVWIEDMDTIPRGARRLIDGCGPMGTLGTSAPLSVPLITGR